MRTVELMVMGLLGLIVVLVVVRPLVRRMLTAEEPLLGAAAAGAVAGLAPSLAGDAVSISESLPTIVNHTAKMIDIAQVQGQVHAQSIQKVGELAEKNPNETVSILRQWLHDTPM